MDFGFGFDAAPTIDMVLCFRRVDKMVQKLLILDLKLLKLLRLAVEQGFQKYAMSAQGVPIFIRELI